MEASRGLRELTGDLTAVERDAVLSLCEDVIAMAPELPGGHPGRAARCGAQLLLELCLPHLDPHRRDALAHAVESIVVRRPHESA